MALTLRGSGQVSADNYGIDSDGSITATGKSFIKNNNSYATSSQTSYDNASLRLDNITGSSSIGTSFGVITPNVNYIQSGYNEGTTAPLTLNPYGGNVGIGETSPDARFHIKNSLASTGVGTSSTAIAVIQNERVNTGSSSSVLRFDTNEITGTNQYSRAAIGAEYDNASNVNGRLMFSTADSSGNLQERMRINASGYVTTPNQPSFLAHSPAGLGSATSIMKNFVTVVHNTGGHLNSTSGYFTAPVAGKYFITAGILVGTGTGRLEFHLEKNSGSPYISGNGTGTTYDGPTISGVFDLSVNDTMRVRLGSGSPHSGGNHPNTYFCGHLLG